MFREKKFQDEMLMEIDKIWDWKVLIDRRNQRLLKTAHALVDRGFCKIVKHERDDEFLKVMLTWHGKCYVDYPMMRPFLRFTALLKRIFGEI